MDEYSILRMHEHSRSQSNRANNLNPYFRLTPQMSFRINQVTFSMRAIRIAMSKSRKTKRESICAKMSDVHA